MKLCKTCGQRFHHVNPAVNVCDTCWNLSFEWLDKPRTWEWVDKIKPYPTEK